MSASPKDQNIFEQGLIDRCGTVPLLTEIDEISRMNDGINIA